MNTALHKDNQLDRNSKFRETADKVCELLGKYDLKVVGYHSSELPYFSALPIQKQNESLALLKTFLQSAEVTEAFGEKLDDHERSLWGALSAMGLIPPSDLFSSLRPGAAIEIYDLEGLQIWRNFTCMQYCSYTLEEVYSVEVYTRYNRDAEKLSACIAKVGDLLTGKSPEIFDPEVAPDILEETFSQDRLRLEVHHQLFCRLKNRQGTVTAWLVMSGAKLLEKQKTELLPRFSVVDSQPVTQL
jgi:hypothetical protein